MLDDLAVVVSSSLGSSFSRGKPQSHDMAPTLVLAIDFKSSDSFLSLNGHSGPAHDIPKDYVADFIVVEWEAPGDLAAPADKTEIKVRTWQNRIRNYERLAAIQSLDVPASLFGDSARSSRVLLAGLRLARRQLGAAAALEYVKLGFSAYIEASVDVSDPGVVEGLLGKVSKARVEPGSIHRILSDAGTSLLRASELINGPAIRPATWQVGTILSFAYEGISMARYQLELAGASKKRADVIPDVPITYSAGHECISPNAPGMPTGPSIPSLVSAYNTNSLNPNLSTPLMIDLYLDIKSPHAYLGVEPARALEREFNVAIRTLPFDMDISSIHGEEFKFDPGVKAPPRSALKKPRTEQQKGNLLAGYAEIRRLAQLRGLTVYGQQKVWDSTLCCLAMLYTEKVGRWAQDGFVDMAFERTWMRKLNLESGEAIAGLVVEATRDLADGPKFLSYASSSEGKAELDSVLSLAHQRGIWGIPSYFLKGEMYWGKEQLGLIRKKLTEMGLAKSGASVGVPYLWRPPKGEAGKL